MENLFGRQYVVRQPNRSPNSQSLTRDQGQYRFRTWSDSFMRTSTATDARPQILIRYVSQPALKPRSKRCLATVSHSPAA